LFKASCGLVPQEDAMKLDPCALSKEPSNENLVRRKREQDAARIDAAIKTALDERFSWRKSGIQGYQFLEKRPDEERDREWAIEELAESGAWHTEGRAMHHCVYR